MSLIFLFIDGVGLGKEQPENPFTDRVYESFYYITNGQPFTDKARTIQNGRTFFTSIDACLGVDGLPQSGTGQATLFSGVNTSRKLGRHFGPYPHSKIRKYLRETSIFQKFHKANADTYFINAFPDIFFEYAMKKNRWSSTTYMAREAGLKLNSINEVLEKKAITAEITQNIWRSRFSNQVPVISEQEAANRLVQAADKYKLVLMEYYLTDKAGHSRDMKQSHEVLSRLNRFLLGLLKCAEEKSHTVIMTSDHGNLEDLSVKTHTRNKVPFFISGTDSHHFYDIQSIQDVTPMCLKWYGSTVG